MTEKEYVEKRLRKIARGGRIKTEWIRKAGLYYQVIKYWGSVRNMQKALKITLQTRNKKIDINKHVQKILKIYKEKRRFPTKKEMGYTYFVMRYRPYIADIILKEISKQIDVPKKIIDTYSSLGKIDKMIWKDPYSIYRIETEKKKIKEIKEKMSKYDTKIIYKMIYTHKHNVMYLSYIRKAIYSLKNEKVLRTIINILAKYIHIEDISLGLSSSYMKYLS